MKILHVLQGISNKSAGTTIYVEKLSKNLKNFDYNVKVFALGASPDEWEHVEQLITFKNWLSIVGLPSYKSVSFMKDQQDDKELIVHAHGIWRSANLFPLVPSQRNAKILWSPHGMFTKWSWNHHRLRKQAMWHTLQRPALQRTFCFHATSNEEVEDIRRLGFRQPIALVPIGVDIPDSPSSQKKEKTILYLSRIHKKKGLDLLIKAWETLAPDHPDWNLLIVGDAENEYGQGLKRYINSKNIPRVRFSGEITGGRKSDIYNKASIFVLPSYSENFGLVIAEALAHGLPVITTNNTPWHELNSKGCGWWIDCEIDTVRGTLNKAISLEGNQLEEMGSKGKEWMKQEYSWHNITKAMCEVYSWMYYKDKLPPCVLV